MKFTELTDRQWSMIKQYDPKPDARDQLSYRMKIPASKNMENPISV